MERLPAYVGLFILSLLVGLLVILVVPATGASDWITFPAALAVIVGVFALWVRIYTPGPRRRGTFVGRGVGFSLYRTGPSPSLEDIAQQLDEGARRRRRGRAIGKRQRSHGKPRRPS